MLNGAPNRRGWVVDPLLKLRCSIVTHPKHWYIVMQQIKQSTIDQVLTMCITQGGVGWWKDKRKREKVQGAWCLVHDMGQLFCVFDVEGVHVLRSDVTKVCGCDRVVHSRRCHISWWRLWSLSVDTWPTHCDVVRFCLQLLLEKSSTVAVILLGLHTYVFHDMRSFCCFFSRKMFRLAFH